MLQAEVVVAEILEAAPLVELDPVGLQDGLPGLCKIKTMTKALYLFFVINVVKLEYALDWNVE